MTNYNKKSQSNRSLAGKAGRIMAWVIAIILAFVLILAGLLLLWSPGKPKPFVDQDGNPLAGSISEKIRVDINGVQQGMFIKSKDATRPVLFFLHGGMPEYWLTQNYPTGLEDIFTVVWWEHRGAGLSYSADIPPETMTVEQLVADTLEVTNYLRKRFGQDKIYLMGHSGGSFIGMLAAAQAPELYHAYIGVAQMAYQLESERLAYEYALEQFAANGDRRMLQKLEDTPVTGKDPLPVGWLSLRDAAMHSLGIGTMRDMKSVITGIFLPSWQFREYTLGEKLNLWRGKFFSQNILRDKMFATDLTAQVTELDIPVYFFHGGFDYTVSYPEAKSYIEKLKAPIRGFYTFEQSAHSPMFEEPEKMHKILLEDVLAGTNSLADSK